MTNKLTTNKDHFDIERIEIVYAIQRIDEEAIKHINAYRINNLNYFITFNMIFEILKDVYEETNQKRIVKQKYDDFKQNEKQEFVKFFSKFIRLSRILQFLNKMLIENLENKLNKDLRSALINNFRKFITLNEMKEHLTLMNNEQRRIKFKINKEQDVVSKKSANRAKTFTSTHQHSFIIKSTIITAKEAEVKKNIKENNCFVCHKSSHKTSNCSDKKAKETMIKKLFLEAEKDALTDNYNSKNE